MRILIVDDSSIVGKSVTKELQRGDYDVRHVLDPREALSLAGSEQWDLITLDVEMPEMTGYEVCKEIRKHPDKNVKDLPIVFVTAEDTLEDRIKGFEAGATNFITKSYRKGELLDIVNGLLRPEATFQEHTILMADDSEIIQKSLIRCLRPLGTKILIAKNGEEAYEIATKEQSKISLIITDYDMPVMNGEELCHKLRLDLGLNSIPIIFLSAETDRDLKLNMFRAGAIDYVQKPFIAEELQARVKAQLHIVQNRKRITELNDELSASNRSLQSFVSMAAHDLRSPIGNVESLLGCVLEDAKLELSEDACEFISLAENSAKNALEVLSALLSYATSNQKVINIERVSLKDLIQQVTSVFSVQIQDSSATIELEGELPEIDADKALLGQVFQNLISNGMKYQAKGNTPRIRIYQAASNSQDKVTIAFQDNGSGIEPEMAKQLFEPFVRNDAHRNIAGTGLGLSFAKNIIERHEGKIWAERASAEGGSIFYVELPLPV